MNVFEIKNCKKIFDGVEVLHNVSCHVEEGEVLSIIGSSGSGKSTLLRCSTLLENMDNGSLSYMGEVAVSVDENDNKKHDYIHKNSLNKIRKNFGLVFQNFNLFPHWTVFRNITDAPISIQKRNRDEVEKEAYVLMEKMGLSDKKDFYPSQLSGGQQQRTAIARSLALNPKILFFDEPTSALDPELTGEILKVIKDLAKEKMTMVIVTHEMSFAKDVSNRVMFMDSGYVVEEGLSSEVFDNPKNERRKKFLSRYKGI